MNKTDKDPTFMQSAFQREDRQTYVGTGVLKKEKQSKEGVIKGSTIFTKSSPERLL